MATFLELDVVDVRFPTSRHLDGSDAMNPDPDYSAVYVTLRTDAGEQGNSLVFTTGRGNDVQAAAVRTLARHIVGREVEEVLAAPGRFAADLIGDSQLRWLGPEKGVMHMAIGAVINAVWDLRCRRENLPLWLLLARLDPEELVDLVDFRYLSDALTREEALAILRRQLPGKEERIARLRAEGLPAYTTTPGWLGYSDEKMLRLLREAREEGFRMVKLKVGADPAEDQRRLRLAREEMGPGFPIAIDANQRWDVQPAIEWLAPLLPYEPYWIEEPTSPDDVLAHAAIRRGVPGLRVATGEQMQSRILAKQFLQAEALDVLQIDATRVGGVHEIVAMLLLAAKFDVPVCPHAGGVGLCEMVQHYAMLDAVAIGGDRHDRWCEYVDHLHEHFVVPTDVHDGAYWPPEEPGIGARMHDASIDEHRFPDGPVWREETSVGDPTAAPGADRSGRLVTAEVDR
ncbi:fuconate dehydratase [Brachybacterium sp. EF45031]|uniref:enolase C-terminal domain-like protein n=1 Tax=Brachybacterium sillae TaxID=2810536 RepID=UPI00217D6AB2|nr:enolase C-terminal domain-like protein [Brachybacterium sillae]MCS6711739.1 fuconate dehydratase [Brachybacterium sillae]